MNKQYTKKQIQEAIAYWEKQLKLMNESIDLHGTTTMEVPTTVGKMIEFLKQYPLDSGFILNHDDGNNKYSSSVNMMVNYWGDEDGKSSNYAMLELMPR